eukprot:1755535-Amphidinium_carterae.1
MAHSLGFQPILSYQSFAATPPAYPSKSAVVGQREGNMLVSNQRVMADSYCECWIRNQCFLLRVSQTPLPKCHRHSHTLKFGATKSNAN